MRGPRGEIDVPGRQGHRHGSRARSRRDDRGHGRAGHGRAAGGRRGLRPAARSPAEEAAEAEGSRPAAEGHRAGPEARGSCRIEGGRRRTPRRPGRQGRSEGCAETSAGARAGARGTTARPGPVARRRLMALEVDVLTLFPPMVEGPLGESIPARIQERGLATVRVHDLRGWGLGRHRTVDDYTYGGGAGMVLRPEVVAAALGDAPAPGLHGDPPRSRRPGLPPGGRPRPGGATAPGLPVPPLRGRGRADQGDGGPGALDRRLRAHRRRARGARDHRRGPAAAARRHRRGVDRGGVVRGRPPRVPAVHPARRPSRVSPCRPCSSRGTTSRCGSGGSGSRCAGRSSGGRTCWRGAS